MNKNNLNTEIKVILIQMKLITNINRNTGMIFSSCLMRCRLNYLIVCYVLCLQIFSINSRTSTLWKLNSDRTKIIEGHSNDDDAEFKTIPQYVVQQDPLFNIITSTEHYGTTWVKQNADSFCSDCSNGFPLTRYNVILLL